MKIGIFDSGIGGLSVLHEAYHMLKDTEYIFYADTDHVPYGSRTPDEIRHFSDDIVKFLINESCDAIIIACNTATSCSAKFLRSKYSLPIIGMEPAVKPAVETNDSRRILVMATPVTLRETKLKKLIDRVDEDHIVDLLPMPQLVNFAENETFDEDKVTEYLDKQFFNRSSKNYSSLVLGCTHFNYFKPYYRKYFDETTSFIDGNRGTIHHIADVLNISLTNKEINVDFKDVDDMLLSGNTTYYFSGRKASKEELEHILRLHKRLESVRNI